MADPTLPEVASVIGLTPDAGADLIDVVIVGAGPAAVYATTEGLSAAPSRTPGADVRQTLPYGNGRSTGPRWRCGWRVSRCWPPGCRASRAPLRVPTNRYTRATSPGRAWDALAPGYDRFTTPPNTVTAEQALHRVGVRPGMRLLDVAAGTGALSIPTARLGAHVVATDISPR